MTHQQRLTMPVGEAMFTQRAIRKLRPDPISTDDLRTILEAAVKAPNGGNRQPARFLVLTDADTIKRFGQLYHEAWWAKRLDDHGWKGPEDIPPEEKTFRGAMQLADEIGDAPLIVLPCAKRGVGGNSVFTLAQNLMLAARALGIGSTLTTLHQQVDQRVHELLGIPDDVEIMGCIPMGYPRGRFGPTKRLPTAETTYVNTWGQPPPWA